jgi:4-carboxymuconolactone decarboxylase
MVTSEEVLRRLTIADPSYVRALGQPETIESPTALDPRSAVLVQLGGLIAHGGPAPIWQQCVRAGSSVGLSPDEMVGALLTLVGMVGIGHVVDAAPDLARALGYDIDAALFGHEDEQERTEWQRHWPTSAPGI